MIKIYFPSLKKASIPLSTGELPDPKVEKAIKGLFAESLLLGDRITLGITEGPNLQIVTLFRWMGETLVEKMLEENIIEFVYAPGVISYITEANQKSLNLQKPGLRVWKAKGLHWNDVFHATDFALKKQTDFKMDYRGRISDLVYRNSVQIPSEDSYLEVFENAKDDIRGEMGRDLGFEIIEDPDSGKIPKTLQNKYLSVASSNVSLYLASIADCNELYANEMTSYVLSYRINNLLRMANEDIGNFRTLLKLENFPDLAHLLSAGEIEFDDLLKLRSSKNTKNFRQWLLEGNYKDQITLIRDYFKKEFKIPPNAKFKVVKTAFFAGLSMGLDALALGVGTASGVGLSLLDNFLLERFLEKWSPRVFINELKSLQNKK